jgi:hypothetical protein
MNLLLSLPTPVKMAIFVVCGGGLFGLLHFGWPGPPASYIIFVAIGVIGASLYAYRVVLKKMDKGKSTPFLQRLRENSSAAPSAVNDPSARARLDDLRRKFEEGIQTFKDHGKDIYSVPWYALVGEPGSGKTEAIRHCNVGFPPGLQDQLQGAGGTLNMNWWFTNHAVILDTAGRLMFEEVAPGATNEWKEFLRLLRQVRPNCPINGMLLVIPVDTLIKDSANEIEAKGSKIAEQLDSIQRLLGVRFPVFVILTKSDLINGFREFFDDLNDPVLQHQMLGWSNPNPLDTPFKPEEVDQHLATVRERLERRRLGLLADPAPRENESDTRLDEVDALYAFTEAISKIGPRLQRYLEMVFVAGEWSQKPLFLRGIYFTSSMRQGEPLDADLAEALGVDVGKLPEGGLIKPKDISFFLKDLFMDKVFRERGLVTRAANTNQIKKQRQLIGLGGAAAVVVLLILFTWIGVGQLKSAIGDTQSFWSAVSDNVSSDGGAGIAVLDELAGDPRYTGRVDVPLNVAGGDQQTVSAVELQADARAQVEASPGRPLIFAPVSIIMGDPFEAQASAQRALFEVGVLRPSVELARQQMSRAASGEWSPVATEALAELLRLETAERMETGSSALSEGSPLRLRPLFDLVFADIANADYTEHGEEDLASLQGVLDASFERQSSSVWPPSSLRAGTDASGAAVVDGVDAFVEYWSDGADAPGTVLGDVTRVAAAAERFMKAESDLRQSGFASPDRITSTQRFDDTLTRWAPAMSDLESAYEELNAALPSLSAQFGAGGRLPSSEEIERRARGEVLETAGAAYDLLLGALPSLDEDDADDEARGLLVTVRDKLTAARAELDDDVRRGVATAVAGLSALRGDVIDPPARGTTDRRAYAVRFAMYAEANGLLTASVPEMELEDVGREAAEVEDTLGGARRLIANALDSSGGGSIYDSASEVAGGAVTVAGRRILRDIADRAVELLDRDLERWAEDRAGGRRLLKPEIPGSDMDGGEFEPAFHPDAAREVLGAYAVARAAGGEGDTSAALDSGNLSSSFDAVRQRGDAYLRAYEAYWTVRVIEEASFRVPSTWPTFQRELGFSVTQTMRELEPLAETMVTAADVLPASLAEAAPGLTRLAEALPEDLENLTSRRYQDDCEDSIRMFADLPSNVPEARRVMLGLRPGELQDDFLLAYREDAAGPGEAYWNSVLLGGIQLLARQAENEAREARTALRTDGQAFPLCLDADSFLDADEFRRALESIGKLAVGSGNADDQAGLVGGGAYGSLPAEVREELDRLRGQRSAQPAENREWVDQLSLVANFLSAEEPLEWEFVVLPLNQQTNQQAALRYRYLQVEAGGAAVPLDGRPRSRSDFPMARTDASFELPQTAVVRVALSESDDTPFTAFAALPADWGGLAALRVSNAEPLGERQRTQLGPEFADVWKLDLPVVDGAGNRVGDMTYSIGVRFSTLVPDLDAWPRTDTWPRR